MKSPDAIEDRCFFTVGVVDIPPPAAPSGDNVRLPPLVGAKGVADDGVDFTPPVSVKFGDICALGVVDDGT